MLAQVNATLTQVSGDVGPEYYDEGEDSGTPKWAGDAPAYYQESRSVAPGNPDVIIRRMLLLEMGNPAMNWATGDTISFVYQGVPFVEDILAVESRKIPGVAGSVRLTLQPT